MVKRLFPWAVGGIILLALSLRLPFLTARSLWFDEAFSWRLSALFPSSEFFSRAAADVHPLLYYALLWVWMLPARSVGPEGTLFWMRLFSVFLGCATVATMTLAGRTLFRSRWVALSAGLLTAVNAFQLQYAWEARMYTLGTALLPLAMVGLGRVVAAHSPRAAWRAGLGFGLSLGALLHVHYYALFSWVALGGAKLLFFLNRMRKGATTVLRSPSFRAAEAGFWLSAVLFLPWVPVFLQQVGRVEAAFWIPHIEPWSIPTTLARLFWGGVAPVPPSWAVLASGAAGALIVLALVRGRSFGDVVATLCFVVPICVSALLSLRTSVFLDQYFLFASLGLLLLLARALSFLPVRSRTYALFFISALGLLSILRFWGALDFPAHPGVRAAAAALRTRAGPGETVLVSSSFAYVPLSFHLGCDVRGMACHKNLNVRLQLESRELAHFAGAPILSPKDLAGSEIFRLAGGQRLWVVDTTGFGGSRLAVPAPYTLEREQRILELFAYQGDIIVREYGR